MMNSMKLVLLSIAALSILAAIHSRGAFAQDPNPEKDDAAEEQSVLEEVFVFGERAVNRAAISR
jgi:hypothetical protein